MLFAFEVFNQCRAEAREVAGDAERLDELVVVVIVESIAVCDCDGRVLVIEVNDLIRASNGPGLQLQTDRARSLDEERFPRRLQRSGP